MAEELRTLHVDTEPTWRGGEQQVLYLTTGLLERGHKAEIVCQPGSPLGERARAGGVPTIGLRMRGEWDLAAAWRLARIIASGSYDLVHTHTARAHTLAGLASWMMLRGRRPKLVVARRVDFGIGKGWLSGLKYRFWGDRYVAVSRAVKGVLVSGGVPAEKVSVVNSCVDLSRFDGVEAGDIRAEFGLPADSILIVDVAFLVEHKAQKYLVAAMPEVIRRVPSAYCLLVGDGELRGALEAQVAELGLGGRVIFTGFRKDALRFIKGADVSVMSSQKDGLGNSVQETLALKRPIVVTDAGGLPEMVEHGVNGLVVPRRDARALADGIIKMLSDPAAAARYGEAGRRTVEERFTRPRLVEKTIEVYREVLGRSPC